MTKNLTVRLDEELAADAQALARAEGTSLNETVKHARKEAVERRRKDPKFKERVRRITQEDRELLERREVTVEYLALTDYLAPYWENCGSSVHGT